MVVETVGRWSGRRTRRKRKRRRETIWEGALLRDLYYEIFLLIRGRRLGLRIQSSRLFLILLGFASHLLGFGCFVPVLYCS